MTDYTVKELLDHALNGLAVPSEDTTETVLADAARHRRRRRTATLLATGAGLAAVAAGGLALPHATAPGRGPVTATATVPPAARPAPAADPTATIAALLPRGSGTVARLKDLSPSPGDSSSRAYATSRFDGNYLITRHGLSAGLMIESYDPAASPAQRPFGPFGADACSDEPPAWKCGATKLADGAWLYLQNLPVGAWTESGTIGVEAGISYPDGRTLEVVALDNDGGLAGAGSRVPGWSEPPMTRAQLAAFVQSQAWFP
ncbi:hypothetical protein [Streptacidiphilus sp. P02-A3a]|uniref:hypothetical protein n=1 Tax=Streptacidiphilus sp. P02-A3a TaxID=2704468 RepID=UPI0015FC95C5|nr:hypothetical protein [Streptacidiphilus sp. P02-A3a]QMU70204.1 hypothetical protein GXP74_20265 [Streptacidiphilus sp. P02-A3a]